MNRKQRWTRLPSSLTSVVFAVCLLIGLARFSSLRAFTISITDATRPFLQGVQVGQAPDRYLEDSESSSTESTSTESSSTASSTAASGSGSSGDGHHKSGAFNPIVFFLCTYTISACCQQLKIWAPHIMGHIPHTVLLFLIGMAMAWHTDRSDWTMSEYLETVHDFRSVDPHVIFWVLLPTLLYEDAAGADWHVVKRVLPNSLLLAFPGVMLNTVLTGGALMLWSSGTDTNEADKWEWDASLLLGSILSATDPVAVVGALNALQAPAKLSSLISGESLFNDGTAVALFQIFLELAAGREEWATGSAILKLLRLSIGGILFGLIVGGLAYVWLAHTTSSRIEILVLVVSIFTCFFLAEHQKVHVSGVLAVVSFGFFMTSTAKFALDVENEHAHHAVIEFLALLSNEAIFIIAGIVSYEFLSNDFIHAKDWLDLGFLYVLIHGTRTIVVVVFSPILRKWGYGLNWKEAIIVIYGGLRGAVGLALGLLVYADTGMSAESRCKVAFHTSGIVFLTLCINGTTVTHIYKALKIKSPLREEYHRKILKAALSEVDEIVKKKAKHLHHHWFFYNTNFAAAMKLVPHLEDHVSFEEEDIFGREKMFHKDMQMIHDAFDQLSADESWRNKEIEARCQFHYRMQQKVRRLRYGNHSTANFFRFTSDVWKEDREQMSKVEEEIVHYAIKRISVKHTERKLWGEKEKQDLSSTRPVVGPMDMGKLAWRIKQNMLVNISGETSKEKRKKGSPKNPEEKKERARQNWKIAKNIILAVIGLVHEVRSANRVELEDDEKEAGCSEELRAKLEKEGMTFIDDSVKARQLSEQVISSQRAVPSETSITRGLHSAGMNRMYRTMQKAIKSGTGGDISGDISAREMNLMEMEEIYQTIVNVTKAEYKGMYEDGALDRDAFVILMEAVANEEEAIHGDFKSWEGSIFKVDHLSTDDAHKNKSKSLPESAKDSTIAEAQKLKTAKSTPKDIDVTPTVSSNDTEKATLKDIERSLHDDKRDLRKAFEVAYRYVCQDFLYRPKSDVANFLYWLFDGKKSIYFEWALLKRNVELLLAFLFTLDKAVEVVEQINETERGHKTKKSLVYYIKRVRHEVLFHVCDHHPAMFFLFEHLLFAKLVVQYQTKLIHEFVEEGAMSEDDAHHILKQVIEPTEKAFRSFVPSRLTLKNVFLQHQAKKLTDNHDWMVMVAQMCGKGFAR